VKTVPVQTVTEVITEREHW